MADDKTKAGKPGRDRINVNQEDELRHWANRLGASTAEVEAAVKIVGPLVDDVRRHLNKR